MDLISVIIPIYNLEQYIERCVRSVMAQSYTNLQIILVDDGSSDGSGAVCDALAQQDSRIKVIHKPNGGVSDARNFGVKAASGQFISFVDGDDYVHPEFIATLHTLCVENKCRMAQCSFEAVTGDSYAPDLSNPHIVLYSNAELLTHLYTALYVETTILCSKLFDASLLRNIRFPVGMIHEDEATSYKLIYAAGKIAVTDAKLYAYFHKPGSITRKAFSVSRLDLLPIMKERAEFFEEKRLDSLALRTWEKYYFLLASSLYHVKKFIPDSHKIQKQLRREIALLAPSLIKNRQMSGYMRLKLILVRLVPATYMRLRRGRDTLLA